MKRLSVVVFAVIALFAAVPALRADLQADLARVDQLHEQGEHEAAKKLLEGALRQAADGRQKAEVYWRLARVELNLGDQAEDRGEKGEQLLAYYANAEELAQKGIDADPASYLSYFWKSANAGRWGQVKGIMNALAKAKIMRDLLHAALMINPEHADSYYVLGQLFEQVPGSISFGDKDWAVSLGRKAVGLRDAQVRAGKEKELVFDYYTQLAKHLWERNWSASKRQKEQARKAAEYAAKSDPLEKNAYYEGSLTLKNLSDREEARELIAWTIRQLESLAGRTPGQEDDLKEARETQAGWRK